MLIQVPRAPSNQEPDQAAARDAFEVALRRDLASVPVVSYEMVLGGLGKRAVDLAIFVLTAPLWAPLLLIAALVQKLNAGKAFASDERVGYGGQTFRRFKLFIPPRKNAPAAAASDEPDPLWLELHGQAKDRRAKWRYALERLPQLFNVLRGEMALVGPVPLSRAQLEALRAGKRHYLSARPGIVGVAGVLDAQDDVSLQYKAYAMSWSFMTDALIFWEALCALPKRGELWRPGLARAKPAPRPAVLHRRRRAS